ncbi:FAD:protein FMN transferase [Pseudorhodoplanes sp.]|uniref:FAD:protein FMN transferase n=1 Tax=Pseudorhodoplanes sp. TaxID=1934341 RepID=UPI002BFAFE26|nr:FAD:protein FMN transferase [Pseudorhodoplanes sp.]HWV54031.1 FAD:protein FMN transferase [Pseudorhodoplanes sp.]
MRRVLVPSHVPDLAPLVPRAAQIVSLTGEAMGTTWSVRLVGPAGLDERPVRGLIEDRLALVVRQMSQWESGSDLSRFNRAVAGSSHVLPDAFFHVLRCALGIACDTNGAYDPTMGALSELWGFGAGGPRTDIPSEAEVASARERVGWTTLAIDRERRTATQPGGLQLDLSSIAKGYAVDLVSDALTLRGFRDHLVEIGGELRGSGTKPDQSPWWVALEDADGGEGDMIVALHGISVATSGDARRFIVADGRKYSHTLDPRTGWPIPDALASVTVFDRSCMRADALATALSVLGAEDGYAFAAARNIAARFLLRTPEGVNESMTPAFADMLG